MKCPSCKTKVGTADYRNDPWAKVDKHGDGYYLCSSCGRSLVHRRVIGPSFLLLIIVAGALSEALAFGVASLINSTLGLGDSASEFVRFACYTIVIGGMCLYYVQPVEVTTE